MSDAESRRTARLLDAQAKAAELFTAVREGGVVTAGISEREASDVIRGLANEMFGVRQFWHKRIVRSGTNTLHPYRENPPDRIIGDDDIVFCDFGPIFDDWEADFGRTFVLGNDPAKRALQAALPVVWQTARAYFERDPAVSGEQLHACVRELAERAGWEVGGWHAGHLIGKFPHELIEGERIESYVTPGSAAPMRRTDRAGQACHWILEVHLIDREHQIGGFYEELLDIG